MTWWHSVVGLWQRAGAGLRCEQKPPGQESNLGTRPHMDRFGSLVVWALVTIGPAVALDGEISTPFQSKDVHHGTVTHEVKADRHVLTLSSDFAVPGTPDSHWQIVDSRGNVSLLDRLKLHEDTINTSITVPTSMRDIAKVQIWCPWAELLLGEVSFSTSILASRGR